MWLDSFGSKVADALDTTSDTLAQQGEFPFSQWFRFKRNELKEEIKCNYRLPQRDIPLRIEGEKIDTKEYEKEIITYSQKVKKEYGFYPPIFVGYGYQNSDRSQKAHGITDASRHYCKHVGIARFDGNKLTVKESVWPTREVNLYAFRKSGNFADMSVRYLSSAQLRTIQKNGGEAVMQKGEKLFQKKKWQKYDYPFTSEEFEQKYRLLERSYCSELTSDYVDALGVFSDFYARVSMPKYKLDFDSQLTLKMLLKIMNNFWLPPITGNKKSTLIRLIQDRALTPEKKIQALLKKYPEVQGFLSPQTQQRLINYFNDPIITPGAFMEQFEEADFTTIK